MAFITLGTANQLTIKVPTLGSTDWGDTMRTDTFLKIAEHDHTGSGSGTALSTGAIAADAITGAKIRLDNNEYLRSRNAANSGDINIIKIDATDAIVLGVGFKNDTYLTMVDNAGTGTVNLAKVNTSDKIAFGADLSNVDIINNTYIQSRNNADSAYISLLKVNTSDKIEVGATVVAASIETTSTSLIDTLDAAVSLPNNTSSATSAGIVTLSTDESCAVHYRLVRGGVTQSGVLRFNDADTVPSESFHGTDVGVTFTVNAGDLEYTTTDNVNATSMTYVVIKE